MIATKSPEFDARLLTGIRVALGKARELGYAVERMDVTASVSKGICKVYFAPLVDPETIITGGDLSLVVDPQTEQITRLQRGQ
jgi:hypothetical protein